MKLLKRIPLVAALLALGILASAQLANADHLPYPSPQSPAPSSPVSTWVPTFPIFRSGALSSSFLSG
jgi:hypothetical protein